MVIMVLRECLHCVQRDLASLPEHPKDWAASSLVIALLISPWGPGPSAQGVQQGTAAGDAHNLQAAGSPLLGCPSWPGQ